LPDQTHCVNNFFSYQKINFVVNYQKLLVRFNPTCAASSDVALEGGAGCEKQYPAQSDRIDEPRITRITRISIRVIRLIRLRAVALALRGLIQPLLVIQSRYEVPSFDLSVAFISRSTGKAAG